MSKTAYLFSGQGSQYVGMGVELAKKCRDSKRIYECAADITGVNIKKICEEATIGELSQTSVSQPAIFTTSLLALEVMNDNLITYDAVAGHSLGEYAAMVAANIVSMEDGYKLITKRANAMQDCALKNPGSMYAILGATKEEIVEICQTVEGYVVPVNYNSPAQTVIAGEEQAVDEAVTLFSEMGKKCMKLAVSAAFHSALMSDAAVKFKADIAKLKIEFSPQSVDFYSNKTGALLQEVSTPNTFMPEYLASHIVSPVHFVAELTAMQNAGITRFIELGPNKVLTGLVKKTLKGCEAMNVENEKSLDKVLDSFDY